MSTMSSERIYRGQRTRSGCRVTVNGQPLPLRLDLVNHSPTGFEWGYGGSGPAQLALAILSDLSDDSVALHYYHDFKWEIVSRLAYHSWEFGAQFVKDWLADWALATDNGYGLALPGALCLMTGALKVSDEPMQVHIRWMIPRDLPGVLAIEAESFERPWSEEDFIRCLRQRNVIHMVAEREEQVVGFTIYELNKTRVHVLNFAVAEQYRRRGVGTQMAGKLIRKLSAQRRTRVTLEVRETNLSAQLFFRAVGFRAVSVLREHFDDSPEDAYLMQYDFRPEMTYT